MKEQTQSNHSPKSDKVFNEVMDPIPAFAFDHKVADVFDDMVTRSIPIYHQSHQAILNVVDHFLPDNAKIYDLGCSTGTTIEKIHLHLEKHGKAAHFVGVDASLPMVEKCEDKLRCHQKINLTLEQVALENYSPVKADLIIMNYTLQFLALKDRLQLLKNIYHGLKAGGILILSEKLKHSFIPLDDFLIDTYYNFKRKQGYSELEIAQKREALENVLIPLTQEEQLDLIKEAGFDDFDVLLRWCNFASFIAMKPHSEGQPLQ